MSDIVQFGFLVEVRVRDSEKEMKFIVTLNELKKLYKLISKMVSKGIRFQLGMSQLEAVLQLDKEDFEKLLQDLLS